VSGVELYIHIREERPETVVLFISGKAEGFRESYPDWPFLNKPFVPREFLTKL
jgi:hypothetical protein